MFCDDKWAATCDFQQYGIFKVANHVVCLIRFSRTLRTSIRTSQVRKTVHNFRYTKSNSCGKVQTPPHFSAQNCVKFVMGSL